MKSQTHFISAQQNSCDYESVTRSYSAVRLSASQLTGTQLKPQTNAQNHM